MYTGSFLNLDKNSFGINVYSASPAVIEIAANWGLDFVFIDTEHSVTGIDAMLEKLVLTAHAAGIASCIRVPDSHAVSLRKTVEMGADGIIVPQVNSKDQMKAIIDAVKFPPLGRRGGDGSVRSAVYASRDFTWSSYIERENSRCKIIPMAESVGFFDNIDSILSVEGIDAVHFGPADFALSCGCPVDYSMKVPEIREAVEILSAKCIERKIRLMLGCAPATSQQFETLRTLGASMFLVGNDMAFINKGCAGVHELISIFGNTHDEK
ncbi:HpcH/HpaI aldolase family protein [Halomonas dongshanensis]|uniref:Aldolase/citrate lyase family protein n=1 Tax=Halomonas dongshanensis TaxID=2890835 RepID=A0ABT2EA78_9GAMM|nr:aldolase/citrate lyase family protein [Halomonas dongshanensis]MCS2608000.1 aldolase/citrate lyase family protein [Halomonas dongshanensis]